VVRVVRRPVVLAGNSIGGFISASVAADYPALVKGLVLLNSAGPIDPAFDPAAHAVAPPRVPPPPWVARGLTAGLMAYLENSIAGQLKWLYPTNPAAADPWLEEEIFRWVGVVLLRGQRGGGQGHATPVGWGWDMLGSSGGHAAFCAGR
jgi:pimeloyl-ACP methyl ester carboxylesterase